MEVVARHFSSYPSPARGGWRVKRAGWGYVAITPPVRSLSLAATLPEDGEG
jgi:hypothetical protein